MVARASEPTESRGQILAAAARLFAARGFEATALQSIADELGVTKQAVLHHFRTKDQLRQAVLDDMLAHWRDALPRLLYAATASEDRFDAVFGELHRFFASEPDRARLLVREALDRPGDVRRVLRGPVRPWIEAVATYIRQGQSSGRHYEDVDPEAYLALITLLVVSAAAAAAVSRVTLGDAADPETAARWDRELARIAKSSLFPPSPPAPARPQPRSRRPRRRRRRPDWASHPDGGDRHQRRARRAPAA